MSDGAEPVPASANRRWWRIPVLLLFVVGVPAAVFFSGPVRYRLALRSGESRLAERDF